MVGVVGSGLVAIAILLWAVVETALGSGLGTDWTLFFALAFLAFIVVSSFAALYPGGFSGLAERFRGFVTPSDFEEFPFIVAVDFLRTNHARLRNRVVKLATLELSPVVLLIALLLGDSKIPASAKTLALALASLRVTVYAFLVAAALVVLTPQVIRILWDRFVGYEKLVETNPRLLKLIIKIAHVEELVSAGIRALYYGLQIVAAFLLVILVGPTNPDAVRLLFLTVAIALSTGFVWAVWRTSSDPSFIVQEYLALRDDIVRGVVTGAAVAKAYDGSWKNIEESLKEPFEIPETPWAVLGGQQTVSPLKQSDP